MKFKLILLSLLLAGSAWLSGCEQEGPAERAGEDIDQTMEEANEAVEQQGPAESVGEKIDQAIEGTGEKINEAGERLESQREETQKSIGEQIERSGERMEKRGEAVQHPEE